MLERTRALWISDEVDVLVGGKSTQPWMADDLTIRANDVRPGDLFFATSGENILDVFEKGAAAVIVSKSASLPADVLANYPVLVVPCAYEALRYLARASRHRTQSVVVAVQGYEQRQDFARAIGAVADYYEGGRHLSSSMAAMPEFCDFSIFSLSPAIAPDIAVIDKPSALRAGNLFEEMPSRGVVLLNGSDPAYLDVLASAKAAGLSNILTYGDCDSFESYIMETVQAQNGVQIGCSVFGQQATAQIELAHNMILPPANMYLAALTVSVLSDMRMKDSAWAMGQVYARAPKIIGEAIAPARAQNNVTLLGASNLVEEAVFRVKNMVDTGFGRKKLILDNAVPKTRAQDFMLPTRMGDLDVVCASKRISVFKNARKAVESLLTGCKLQHIVPDVLTPGDFVVFKSKPDAPCAEFSESLRMQA